jgi:molybdate transport system ATP-binding protein
VESASLAEMAALARQHKLLVLDEPDASLDSGGADLLARVMRGRTAVIATHDHALANRLCQRTLVLRRGRVVGVPTRLRVVH